MMRSGRMRSALRTRSRWCDLAAAFQAGRPGFQPHHVRLLQLQFGRVLDRDDALAVVDQPRHRVHQRGLAGAGAARDDHVEPARPAISSTRATCGVSEPYVDQLGEIDLLPGEFADRDVRAVERQRREHDVDAGAVLEPRIDHRAGFVDAAADRGGDALADVGDMRGVAEIARSTGPACRARSTNTRFGPLTMMSVMVSSSSSGSSGPRPSMSSTSSPASWRCSRPLSWMCCSVAISDSTRSTSSGSVGRHVGEERDRAAPGRPRAARRSVGRLRGRDPAAAGAARVWLAMPAWQRRRRRMTAASTRRPPAGGRPKEGSRGFMTSDRTGGGGVRAAACRRSPDAARFEQADKRHLSRQLQHAGAETAARRDRRVRPGWRRGRPPWAGRESDVGLDASALLRSGGGSTRPACRRGSAPARRGAAAWARGSASSRSMSRTEASVGSITSTR